MAHHLETSPLELLSREHTEIIDVYEKLRQAEAKLISPDGKTEILPNNLYSFLLRLLAELKEGRAITILQSKHELTTAEAAKLLGMSRQYLVQLLEKGEIPFHMTGTHRRIYFRDAISYRAKRDADRRKILNNLAKREFEQGDYGKVPDVFRNGK